MAVAALILAAIWPAYAQWLTQRALPAMPPLQVSPVSSWQPGSTFTDWTPHWLGADRQFRGSFSQGPQQILLEVDYYATQRQDAELINSQNFMVQQKHPVWSQVGESRTEINVGGQPRVVRQALLKSVSGQRLLVWQWNVINGQREVSDARAKLILAAERVRLARDDGAAILVAAPYTDNPAEAAPILARFIQQNEAAIQHGLEQVAGK